MENSNERPCPTGPGWWYRRHPLSSLRVVYVWRGLDELRWKSVRDKAGEWPVEDDGKWLGPVPMPGQWAPRDLFEELRYQLGDTDQSTRSRAARVLSDARAWSNANPEPEATP